MSNHESSNIEHVQPVSEREPASSFHDRDVLPRVEGAPENPVILQARFQHHSGPLPPPEIMAAYDRIVPGGAARIFASFEKQLDHRISIEKEIVSSNAFSQRLGAVSAMLVALIGIGGAVFLIESGHDLSGLATILLVVSGIVTTFITGKRAQSEELAAKQRGEEPSDEDESTPE